MIRFVVLELRVFTPEKGRVSASAAGHLAFESLQESVNVWSVPIDAERATAAFI